MVFSFPSNGSPALSRSNAYQCLQQQSKGPYIDNLCEQSLAGH